ncbi:MAG: histidinol dehydrogenase [Gammaproteobacteria bacterium]|nr:histidinol dehydrogenase [Gammaproteobacteria bacterium]OUU10639.1 MAG: histidinol dehydrogenase [Gammaproteobacteria bacterium TMED34]
MSISGISILRTVDVDFDKNLTRLGEIPAAFDVSNQVDAILSEVRKGGDRSVVALTNRLDGLSANALSDLEVSQDRMRAAVEHLDPLVAEALTTAIVRVRRYHEEQKRALGDQVDWSFEDAEGNQLGQIVRGMKRIGVYAPGGKAAYPSTVIMTVVPARVAEVGEVLLTVPAPGGEISDVLLAAASLAGVDRVFTIGGAQAIAAMAYGTETIPQVDKIVGPGNLYVATAKQRVFGVVGIDMVAGPSEVVIVADDSANADWLVMDMFAQAEHDEMAQSILISSSDTLLTEVDRRIDAQLSAMPRAEIIQNSIFSRGALIQVRDQEEAISIVNQLAPEHLELAVANPDQALTQVSAAGAIFLGHHAGEVVGDYTAGPSHVLPTSRSARFASPLGVYDFQVRSSVVQCSARGAVDLSRDAAILAEAEGLTAHAASARLRVQG